MGVWPPAIGLQEQVANHHERLRLRAMVVSVMEKVLKKHQVWIKKTNTSEPPFNCRKLKMTSKPGFLCCPGMNLAETCLLAR